MSYGFFPDAGEMTIVSLFFMLIVYGFILFNASKTISDGCELLLLTYGPGIIGGLIIPILGAVPDCAIIVISGIGSGTVEQIQQNLAVGVGTLVGSSVMLLTLPWGLGVYFGRRTYDPETKQAGIKNRKPYYAGFSFTQNCITTMKDIPGTAKLMMIASISYWIIQIPAFVYTTNANREAPYALTGFIVTLLGFISYCIFQLLSAQRDEQDRRIQEAKRREEWKKKFGQKSWKGGLSKSDI